MHGRGIPDARVALILSLLYFKSVSDFLTDFLTQLQRLSSDFLIMGSLSTANSLVAVLKSPSAFSIHSRVICFIEHLTIFDNLPHKSIVEFQTILNLFGSTDKQIHRKGRIRLT